ncbi:MAG: PilZ domain-containing protein [Idiomarina sp.]|nr:PilZ domain-containing protein [Idiomarina sp.]
MEDSAREQLIEQLKPVVNEPEFDKIFSMLTSDMSGPERFQLKSELRRLAAPCNRQVDLRKRVAGDVQPYNYRGQIHYMDPVAIAIFEDGLDRYQGVFTQDTFERIFEAENNFRVMELRAKELALAAKKRGELLSEGQSHADEMHRQINQLKHEKSIAVPYFTFGRYTTRREERMNYAGAIEVAIDDWRIPAVTADISVSGIRIRLKVDEAKAERHPFEPGSHVAVYYTGFARDFTLDVNEGIGYVVVAVEKREQGVYLRLKRRTDIHSDDFDAFLSRFISGYKHRYKVNVDNVMEGLTSKAHEQLYLPRLGSVPLFFKRVEKRMFPKVALETQMNATVLDSWLDEQNDCVVSGLFSGKRLGTMLKQLRALEHGMVETTFYCFQVLRKGRVYFYSATVDELADPQVRRVFLAYASRRAHFRVYRFALTKLDIGKAWMPLTVPRDIAEKERLVVRPPSPVVMKELEGLSHVGLLTDITPPTDAYTEFTYENSELTLLNDFVHPRKGLVPLQRASFDFVNVRDEHRFNYRTQVRIRAGDQVQLGMTRDFSTKGLQIEVERPMDVIKGDVVEIDFPQLSKNFPNYELKKLAYEVMNVSPDLSILHLKVVDEDEEHPARRFFRYLISANQKALKTQMQSGTVYGLQLCLRNLYCNALMSLPLFLQKPKGEKFRLHRAGVSPLNEPMKLNCLELSQGGTLNLQPLISERFIRETLEDTWSALDANSRPWATTVLIRRGIEQGALRTRRMRLSESTDMDEARKFLQQGLDEGEVYALRFTVCRTGQPDTEFIANEFRYLAQYAPHRAQEVEEEMWSVVGLVDVVPVTTEVLTRFSLRG